eukprot:SAG11_NODE_1297_length_5269_cov_3.432302_3_plen_150_part_00
MCRCAPDRARGALRSACKVLLRQTCDDASSSRPDLSRPGAILQLSDGSFYAVFRTENGFLGWAQPLWGSLCCPCPCCVLLWPANPTNIQGGELHICQTSARRRATSRDGIEWEDRLFAHYDVADYDSHGGVGMCVSLVPTRHARAQAQP